MNSFDVSRMIIGAIAIILVLAFCINNLFFKKRYFTTQFIAKTAIFAALSVILYIVPIFKFTLPIFPAFLEIHLDEVPAFIAAYAYGPFSGLIIIIIKTIIKLPFTTSMCVGEFADLLYSTAFIIPAAIIYKRKNNFKGAVKGFAIGTLCQLIVASFFTSFVILNFYMFVMGLSEQAILSMCQAVNPNVTSLGMTFLVMVALPFNLVKDAIVIAITLVLYKKLHTLIDKMSTKKLGY